MKFSGWVPLTFTHIIIFPSLLITEVSQGTLRTCANFQRFYMHYYMASFRFRDFKPFGEKGAS